MPDTSFLTTGFLGQGFDLNLGKYSIPVTYWEAVAIVILIFLLIVVLAQYRRHYVDWSLKGSVAGVFFGFFLALILEGFLIIGGKTFLSEIFGWKTAPAPISIALDSGRSKLIQVLGVKDQIPSSYAKETNSLQNVIQSLQALSPKDRQKIKNLFCTQ